MIYVAVVVYSFLVLGGDILGGEVGKTSFIEDKCTVCSSAGWPGHLQLYPAYGDAAVGRETERGGGKTSFY